MRCRSHSLLLAALLLGGAATGAFAAEPRLVLWAWERHEDLSFLDSDDDVEVAYLAGTLRLAGELVTVRPRYAALRLPTSVRHVPVVRIELDRRAPAALSPAQQRDAVEAIAALVDLHRSAALQIDFDAPTSARPFYAALLQEVRNRLAPTASLSMTALASWCFGDRWLARLPVDEVVPMYFRMGRDDAVVRSLLARGGAQEQRCRPSAGVTLDEVPPDHGATARLYVFPRAAWSAVEYARARELVAEAQR